jgi:hypothetical protein
MDTTIRRLVNADDFNQDPHAAKYRGELDRHPDAFADLFAILNEPANEQRLMDAEMHGLPALTGVVRFIESEASINRILKSGPSGFRFRQTVGVAIKLKMARLGWCTTGKKGVVKGAEHFTKAEHYEADPANNSDYTAGALSALEAVAEIGDDSERDQTGQQLMEALTTTRHAEGRPF